MEKFSLKYFALLSISLLFLPAFVIFISPKTDNFIPVYAFLISIFFILFILKSPINFINKIVYLYKNSTFKYFVWFFIWIFISVLVNVIQGHFTLPFLHYLISYKYILFNMIMCFLFPCFFAFWGYKIKSFAKFLAIIYLFIFGVGLISFIGGFFKIEFLTAIIDFITNAREGIYIDPDIIHNRLFPRVYSVFLEPSDLGRFIFISFPIIYRLSLSKYKIFDNKYLNKIVKSSLVPLSWLNLIFTQSPIYLVLCFFLTLVYFFKSIICIIKKHFIPFTVLVLMIFTLIITMQGQVLSFISDTYLGRIITVLQSLDSFDKLIMLESSLATRIVSYVNLFLLSLHYPIFGTGFQNAEVFMYEQFANSPLNLTPENVLFTFMSPDIVHFNRGLFYTLLAETGFVGGILFYWIFYKSIKAINIIKNKTINLEYDFLAGLKGSLIALIAISFYNINIENIYLWLYLGLVCAFYISYREDLK